MNKQKAHKLLSNLENTITAIFNKPYSEDKSQEYYAAYDQVMQALVEPEAIVKLRQTSEELIASLEGANFDFQTESNSNICEVSIKKAADYYFFVRGLVKVALCQRLPVNPPICSVPPTGWHCTRSEGHSGPCAAIPISEHHQPIDTKEVSEKEFWEMCAKVMFACYVADQNKQNSPSNRAAMIVKALGYKVKE